MKIASLGDLWHLAFAWCSYYLGLQRSEASSDREVSLETETKEPNFIEIVPMDDETWGWKIWGPGGILLDHKYGYSAKASAKRGAKRALAKLEDS